MGRRGRVSDEVSARRPQDIDRHVGARIRQRRIMLGLSQMQLGELIGTTDQQACRYETGMNRISAGRLYQIAQVLGVEIGYFFERLAGKCAVRQQRMLVELTRNFTAIPDERHRAALWDLARKLAKLSDGSAD